MIDDEWFKSGPPAMPAVNVGGTFPGAHVGILDYAFGEYRIQLRSQPVTGQHRRLRPRDRGRSRSEPDLDRDVQRREPRRQRAPREVRRARRDDRRTTSRAPDIVGLEEIQDNNGAVGRHWQPVVDATVTLDRLVAAIKAAGGPTYSYRQIDPVAHQDGGEPGGNIRVGFLYRTDRGLAFVDRPGGDSTTAVSVVAGPDGPAALYEPGPDRADERGLECEPQAARGRVHLQGHKLFVIVNHFNSKGGDQPLFGPSQPPVLTHRGAAEPAGDAPRRLRRPHPRRGPDGERRRHRRPERLPVLVAGAKLKARA